MFSQRGNFNKHVRNHTGAKDFKCCYANCNKTFSQQDGLNVHIKAIHDQIRDYECSDCNYKASQYSNLVRHIETCIGGERGSAGEFAIKGVLDTLAISYQREKRFDDCKNIRALPFDFYLAGQSAMIEFDGRQHFEAVDYYGGISTLERTQKCDVIKNAYCLANNIHLLRIKYTDFKRIQEIVTSFLARLESGRIISQYMGCELQFHIILPH
jgi:hypothetical protein